MPFYVVRTDAWLSYHRPWRTSATRAPSFDVKVSPPSDGAVSVSLGFAGGSAATEATWEDPRDVAAVHLADGAAVSAGAVVPVVSFGDLHVEVALVREGADPPEPLRDLAGTLGTQLPTSYY